MKVIENDDENLERIMKRIQCDRDKNFRMIGIINDVIFKANYCCHPDGLTIEPNGILDFLSISPNGETGILTIDP